MLRQGFANVEMRYYAAMEKIAKTTVCVLIALLSVRLIVMAVSPVFEPSEARYAAISANMARTSDWLVPRFTHKGIYQPFSGKPPLVFQTSALACRAIGISPFAVRIAPFVSFLILLAALFVCTKRLNDAKCAWAAVMACSSSVALYAAAGFCMTDVPLACCTTGTLLAYALFRERPSLAAPLWAGAALGCGMLVKGPVVLALCGVAVLADATVNRRWNTLFNVRWLAAVPVFFAISTPWFILMHREDPGFLRYFFINENLLRFLVHNYGDRYGAGRETFRGMAAIWAFVVALPWSLIPLKALRGGWRRRSWIPHDFFLVSALAITTFWCLTSRAPLAYLLPIVPLFSVYVARSWREDVERFFPGAAALSSVMLVAVILVAAVFSNKLPGSDAQPRLSGSRYSYEFYHGPWGKGASK